MDELTSKLKKLWKPKPKTFKGKGNILGRAEEVQSLLMHPSSKLELLSKFTESPVLPTQAPKPSRPPPKAPSKQSPPPEICPTTANHASSSQPVNPLNESVRVVPASELAAPSPGVTVKPGTAGKEVFPCTTGYLNTAEEQKIKGSDMEGDTSKLT